MALRKIVTPPNQTLRRKGQSIEDFGDELQTLIDDMVETLRDAPGVGLAAPQVDISQRVIVVEYGPEPDIDEDGNVIKEYPKKLYTLVNPEIARAAPETVVGTEGCLSLPGLLADVERSVAVTVKAQTRRGQTTKIKAEGWLARIFQHEIDHVNGILMTDRADKVYQMDEEADPDQPIMAA
jgi:peptide deformylase